MEVAVEAFLKDLDDKTIYKCMLIGITDEGDIKSPSDGAFYVSKETRVDYLVMKVKKGMKHFAFKYRGIEFANWTFSYKVWLTTDVIQGRIEEALEKLKKMNERVG